MELLWLEPDQIVAMIDYPPLHSPQALAAYVRAFRAGVPPVSPIPVLSREPVLAAFRQQEQRFAAYRSTLQAFLESHPAAEYWMLGGTHRAAAAVLAGMPIPCALIADDADFEVAAPPGSGLNLHGDHTTVLTPLTSVDEELRILEAHYFEHRRFWTMAEKVRTMIAHGDVPAALRG